MSVQRERVPYELLLRWDDATGAFRGAQIQWIERVTFEGEVLSEKLLPAEPVSVKDGEAGFPLLDVMSAATRDALAAQAVAARERDDAIAAERQAAEERDAAMAEIARLSALPAKPDAPVKAPAEELDA